MSESQLTIVVLPSVCAACGKTGHNYQVDRVCFSLVCLDCLETYVCPCEQGRMCTCPDQCDYCERTP